MTILLERPAEEVLPVAIATRPPQRRPSNWVRRPLFVACVALLVLASVAVAGTAFSSRTPAGGAPAWAARALSAFVGQDVSPRQFKHWSETHLAYGTRWEGILRNGDVVEYDARTHAVNEVVFSDHLTVSSGPLIGTQTALAAALPVVSRFATFQVGLPRSEELLDHGVFAEWRFQWQERAGAAWAPDTVVVGENGCDLLLLVD
jgi:hypothetical protein